MEYMKGLKRAHQTAVIIYIAFMVSLGIYVVVVEIFLANIEDFQGMLGNQALTWIRYFFYGLGLAQILIIRVVRQILTKGLNTTEIEDSIAHLSKISILTAAFCEIPAIFGLVLFFLRGDPRDFYVLTAISFVFFFMYFPRYSNWEEWVTSKIRN